MKHNAPMGLIDRIFKGGKDRDSTPGGVQPSTQFHESEPDTGETQEQRNAPRRELVQVVLRDTMRKHGIPSEWIECRVLSSVSRTGRHGLHVNFVVKQAHDQLIGYVFAFQDSFVRELARFEPRAKDWLMSLGWEFPDVKAAEMPDPGSWAKTGRGTTTPQAPAPAPLAAVPAQGESAATGPSSVAASAAALAAAPMAAADGAPQAQPGAQVPQPSHDEDVQNDLQALFAIRDAALADAARKPVPGARHHVDFQPTQPFGDEEKPAG